MANLVGLILVYSGILSLMKVATVLLSILPVAGQIESLNFFSTCFPFDEFLVVGKVSYLLVSVPCGTWSCSYRI